jgi:hypothetical protein
MLAVDVDAATKLAHWGLLGEAPILLGTSLNECYTLTSLKYRARKSLNSPDGKVFHSVDAAQAVIDAMEKMAPAPKVPLISQLQDIDGIDPGEAVLLSGVAAHAGSRILTGDKRALRSLAACDSAFREQFSGRIVIVEQVVLAALDRFGLVWLRSRICAFRTIDKAMVVAMGSRCDAGESAVREALNSYVNEITALCNPPLLS